MRGHDARDEMEAETAAAATAMVRGVGGEAARRVGLRKSRPAFEHLDEDFAGRGPHLDRVYPESVLRRVLEKIDHPCSVNLDRESGSP